MESAQLNQQSSRIHLGPKSVELVRSREIYVLIRDLAARLLLLAKSIIVAFSTVSLPVTLEYSERPTDHILREGNNLYLKHLKVAAIQ